MARLIAFTSLVLVSMATARQSKCNGNSCAPEIRNFFRPDIFMERTDSQSVFSSEAAKCKDPPGTKIVEDALSDGLVHKGNVLNWDAYCTSVFLKQDLSTAPCPKPYTQLCYRIKNKDRYEAIFAVCYDTYMKIPLFTAHVLKPGTGKTTRGNWKIEDGLLREEQAAICDYEKKNMSEHVYFLSRGHLVPDRDFEGVSREEELTFYLTNIAPQWDPANDGNWAALEGSVGDHCKKTNRTIHVLTGTADHKKFKVKMNDRVVIPGVYWKAVCDVTLGESVLFWSTNPYGSKSKKRQQACSKYQTEEKGVVHCLPVSTLNSRFVAGFSGFPAVCKITKVGSKLLHKLDIKFQ